MAWHITGEVPDGDKEIIRARCKCIADQQKIQQAQYHELALAQQDIAPGTSATHSGAALNGLVDTALLGSDFSEESGEIGADAYGGL